MKLIHVEMQGFRSYQMVGIDFSQHRLTRIRGSNGVGKSAIVESLGWAIFGRLRDGGTIRDATHRLTEPDKRGRPQQPDGPSVGWTVEIDGKIRHITRWKGNAVVEDDSGRRFATGSRRVAPYFVEQHGTDYDDLRATAWCLQGDTKRPVTMGKHDRRRLIRRLFLDGRRSSTASGKPDDKPEDTVRKARAKVTNARHQLDAVIEELKEGEQQETSTRRRLDSLRERWQATLERRSRHEVLIAKIAGLGRERERLWLHLEDCTENLRAIREMEARLNRFDPAALNTGTGQLEEGLLELDCLETAVQDIRDKRLIEKARADACADWYSGVEKALTSAITRGQCSTCERRLWTGHSILTGKRDHAHTTAQKFRLRSDRTSDPAEEEVEMSADLRQTADVIEVLQSRVWELQHEHGYCEAAKSMLSRIQSQAKQHAELEAEVAETSEHLAKCKRDRDALHYRKEEHERLNANVKQAEVEWREAWERAEQLRKRRDDLDRQYKQLVQAAMDASAEAVGIDVQEDKVRSDLAKTMNEIVTALTQSDNSRPQFAVNIDEDFKPTLHEHNGQGPTVSSGGLDVILALAMRLALMRLVKDKHDTGSPIGGVLILDEPFGNVDTRWRKGLLNLLEQERWRVDQVVEISSWDRADDATEVPRRDDNSGHSGSEGEVVYTVTLVNGKSEVHQGCTAPGFLDKGTA